MKEETNMSSNSKLQSIFEENELSLRKVALNLDLNYNMLLKASKKPIVGVAYDPNFVNYDEVESYITKHIDINDIDWTSMKDSSEVSNMNLPSNITLGTHIKVRGDDEVYEVKLITPTHLCILPIEGSQPRVMSIPTFLHQSPKVVG
jgi:hypothetical protein